MSHSNSNGGGPDQFDKSWSEERIFNNISEIALDPQSVHLRTGKGTHSIIGVRDGEIIRVNLAPSSEGIIEIRTAYPMRKKDNIDSLINQYLVYYGGGAQSGV